MKILLVSLLLISCGIDEDKNTDDEKDPTVSETKDPTVSEASDLASKHKDRTIFSFDECDNKESVPVFDSEGNPEMEGGTQKTETHPSCNYHRIAENADCGTAGNQCQITILPMLKDGDETTAPKTKGWHFFNWQAGCTCSKEKLSEQQQTPGSYRCIEDKCSLDDLKDGLVKKATRNGKPTDSDVALSELEKDLLEDMVKDIFENLPKDTMFTEYFEEDEDN